MTRPTNWNAIVDDLENCQAADDTFSINFTSTSGSGKVGHPKKYATTINDYLLSYDWQAGTSYGIVVVDFATKDLQNAFMRPIPL